MQEFEVLRPVPVCRFVEDDARGNTVSRTLLTAG